MFRTILFLLIGYIIWSIVRIMQRSAQARRSAGIKRGYDRVHSSGGDRKSSGPSTEVRDAEFEDIDPPNDGEH